MASPEAVTPTDEDLISVQYPKKIITNKAMLQNVQNSPVDANSGHGSTHPARNVSMDNLRDVHED
ncbi:hypothetical protein PIB30_052869 [Stylosanthes scabra]|uniref:Uncharacterized protein n=1 Tax=Stylosanthes scabra TaxID=79078 RepID=A0ABU6WGK3_9FABA|nr:hypothetical protein [Stylosanthes scabra]